MFTLENRRTFLKKSLLAASAAAFGAGAAHGRVPWSAGPQRDYVEILNADVLVVGAGAAGIPAAIAAARTGAKVILLEREQTVGGAPVHMFVGYFCGGPRYGIFREMAEALNATEQITGIPFENYNAGAKKPGQWFLPSSFLRVLNRMLAVEKNITVITGATVCDAIVDDKGNVPTMKGVEFARAGNRRAVVLAPVTIDATGTGELSEMAGCQTLYGRDARRDFKEALALEQRSDAVMPCTLMVILQRIRKGAKFEPTVYKMHGKMESGLGWVQGKEALARERDAGVYVQWGASVKGVDTRDPEALAKAYGDALAKMEPDLAAGMEAGFGVQLAPKIGVREVRRVVGDHVITCEDLKSKKMPDDVISVGRYFLDIWGRDDLTKAQKAVPLYGIPYRATIAKGIDGLMLAGKHLSGTSIAMSSYRVQPILAAIGEGAGTAAAMAAQAKTTPRRIDVRALQKTLVARGSLPAENAPV